MYNIMLIDDEPLILSGIKSLLDWEQHDCQITATARNGKEALEKIRLLCPNIIFCDINMPIISGIELLETLSKEMPTIVFIMLTNLQDFDLVQNAIHFRALDYIVKTKLDSNTLLMCLEKAKEEWDNRNKLENINTFHFQPQNLQEDFLKEVFLSPTKFLQKHFPIELFENAYFKSYRAVRILLTYNITDDKAKIDVFTWVKEFVSAIAEKHFSAFHLFSTDQPFPCITLLCENLSIDIYKQHTLFSKFHQKLCTASQKITNTDLSLLVTDCYQSIQDIYICRQQIEKLQDIYYNTELPLLIADSISPLEFQPLKLTGFSVQLEEAIREKNAVRCTTLINQMIRRIKEVVHERSHAIWLCNEIYIASCDTFFNIASDFQMDSWFFQKENVLNQINSLYTRSQLLTWLTTFNNTICTLLSQLSQDQNQFIELAKEYVESHMESHISLSDAADYVNLSPAYLSSLFHKSCNESFVNYIHRKKIAYACRLIQEKKYFIYEISYRLGFNNAYYFSKIFKRYTGMTPIEYQNSCNDTNK